MCGFLGIINTPISKENWFAAMQTIDYRGTIWGNYFADRIQIACKRLARNGNSLRPQPIMLKNKGILAVNGEIYNIKQLNKKIPCSDDIIDTEELIRYLNDFSISKLNKLNGEFALAYFDFETEKLYLARDALGTKPLYFAIHKGSIAFGSSASGTRRLLFGDHQLDDAKLVDMNIFSLNETGNCFTEINTLPPGTLLTFCSKDGSTQLKKLFATTSLSKDSILKQFTKSVIRRATGLADTGLAYSGGLDSSIIKAIADSNQCHMKSFKLVLDDQSNLTEKTTLVNLHWREMESLLPRVAEFFERPICASLSSLAMTILYKKMNEKGIKVTLSGEGADELFLGYPIYFKDSFGHPGLIQRKTQNDFLQDFLGFNFETKYSPMLSLLEEPNAREWIKFDREIRLPEHLFRINNDIPSLVSEIESRVPFLDLAPYAVDIYEKWEETMKQPKELLWKWARHLNLEISFRKIGLYAGFTLIPLRWIRSQMEYVLEGLKHFSYINGTQKLLVNLSKWNTIYDSILSLPQSSSLYYSNSLKMFFFSLWSTLQLKERNNKLLTLKYDNSCRSDLHYNSYTLLKNTKSYPIHKKERHDYTEKD